MPPAFVQMVQQNAERIALDLLDRLVACGVVSKSRSGRIVLSSLPVQYWPVLLLELAAATQLHHWEAQGLHEVLEPLPSFNEAVQDIRDRLTESPASFLSLSNAHLFRAVNEVFCSSLAWEAGPILGATMTLRMNDEERVLDAIAELLWTNRSR